MRKRTARMLWLVAGVVVLGLLAISATNYVMRLDQEAQEVGSAPIGRDSPRTVMAAPGQP